MEADRVKKDEFEKVTPSPPYYGEKCQDVNKIKGKDHCCIQPEKKMNLGVL